MCRVDTLIPGEYSLNPGSNCPTKLVRQRLLLECPLAGLHEACCLGKPEDQEDAKDVDCQGQQEIPMNDIARQYFEQSPHIGIRSWVAQVVIEGIRERRYHSDDYKVEPNPFYADQQPHTNAEEDGKRYQINQVGRSKEYPVGRAGNSNVTPIETIFREGWPKHKLGDPSAFQQRNERMTPLVSNGPNDLVDGVCEYPEQIPFL